MTTLVLAETFPPRIGGSGRYLWEVYRRLPREAFVIAAGDAPGQEDFDRTHDARLHRTPLTFSHWGVISRPGLSAYWKAVQATRRLVAQHHIQRIHCARCLPEGWIGWLFKQWLGLPYVCFTHGEELNYASGSRELRWLMRRVLHGADYLIANSRNTARIIREEWGMPAERIRLLYPGVDTAQFVPAARDVSVRERLGWGQRPVVMTVGRLQRRKGHDQMILALHAVRRAIPQVLYVIIGDGDERASLVELVAREGLGEHVQFRGELDEAQLLECYQQCDLFALPNRQVGQDIEGFGMVLLEAQACGKPVIGGASGGTVETMNVPETGLVIPCETPDALARCVSELLSDPERMWRMGTAARAWAVGHFDWSVIASRARQWFQSPPEHA